MKTGIMKWLLFLASHVISCIPCYLFFLVVTDNAATVSPGSARKQDKRERERIRFATMSIEERTERNTKQRERYNIMKSTSLSVCFNYKFIIFVE